MTEKTAGSLRSLLLFILFYLSLCFLFRPLSDNPYTAAQDKSETITIANTASEAPVLGASLPLPFDADVVGFVTLAAPPAASVGLAFVGVDVSVGSVGVCESVGVVGSVGSSTLTGYKLGVSAASAKVFLPI